MTSQINPNNINGNYPIAGVSNNTQGMRDNFTNIKQNFQYAENEIDDLQSKVLLKAALTGTTLDNNMADNLIYAAKIQDFSATQVMIAATSGSIAVDYSAGHYQTIAMAGNISLSFTNFPAAGSVGMLRLQIVVDTIGRTMTLPSAVSVGTTGVQGYSANVITFAAAGTFEFGFVTTDAGTTITLFDLNRPLSYYTNAVTLASGASLGVGTPTPDAEVTILGYPQTATYALTGNSTTAGTDLHISGANGSNTRITQDAFGTSVYVAFTGRTARGTAASPTQTQSNDVLSQFTARGFSNGALQFGNVSTGRVDLVAGENFTDTSRATKVLIYTTPTGTITPVNTAIFDSTGAFSVTGNATILSGTAVPAGGTAGAGLKMSSTTNLGVFFGSGVPTLAAAKGSLYLRTDGSTTNDRMYVNTNGSTTWTAVTTVA